MSPDQTTEHRDKDLQQRYIKNLDIINEIKKGVANHTLILIHFINFTTASILEIACTVFYVYYFALCSVENSA